jgi:hypothetical protein
MNGCRTRTITAPGDMRRAEPDREGHRRESIRANKETP